MRQLSLFHETKQNEFGGSLLTVKRKSRRPLDTSCLQHLILKASDHQTLLNHHELVVLTLQKYAIRHGVRIEDCAVNEDHVHLVIAFANRISYVRWIRSVTSVLSRKLNNLKWKFRPYTRNVKYGKGLAILKNYLHANRDEAEFAMRAMGYVRKFEQEFQMTLAAARESTSGSLSCGQI